MAETEAPDDESVSPRAPARCTAQIDQRRGTMRGRGRLDRRGADLLSGTVDTLRRRGHRHIIVTLVRPCLAEPAAWELLAGEVNPTGRPGCSADPSMIAPATARGAADAPSWT